jgi:hypothetical protein
MKIRKATLAIPGAILMLIAARAMAQTAPAATNPLDPLSWLVGGKWVAEGDKGPDGKPFHVESVMTWGDNGRIMQFTTRFREEGKLVPVYSGMYAWNPARQRFVFLYTDNHGSLTEGEARMQGDRLEQEFEIVGADGAAHSFRSTIVRRGPDDYDWNVLGLKEGKWSELLALKYKRRRD